MSDFILLFEQNPLRESHLGLYKLQAHQASHQASHFNKIEIVDETFQPKTRETLLGKII